MLARQRNLLSYLTDPSRFENDANAAEPDDTFAGLPLDRLRLIGSLSLAKRLDKIRAVLPKTWSLVNQMPGFVEEFASCHPPKSLSRLENSEQFCHYLYERLMLGALSPSFVFDIAAFELAVAHLRNRDPSGETDITVRQLLPAGVLVRRSRHIELLRCAHDIRCVVGKNPSDVAPMARDVYLALVSTTHATGFRALELTRDTFTLLNGMSNWRRLTELNDADDRLGAGIISMLQKNGLIELRQ